MQINAPQTGAGSSRRRFLVFTLGAIALPLVAVLLIEGVLRLAGVGAAHREPFQPVDGRTNYVALDPEFGGMFFRQFRPGVAFDPIAAEKAPGTLRVVALGGSTTAGFPYHWYYGFPALLEDRIASARPGQPIEMANLGMTATNSYTIWALAESVVGLRPDAVLIYAGHNEYYGAYGTAGTQGWSGTSRWIKRLLIGASRWSIVSGPAELFKRERLPAAERKTLMARIVRDASIRKGDEVYLAGIAQFEANLSAALRRFERAGVPVFLATIASNLSDQPPLGDEDNALAAYDRGRKSLAAGDTAAARRAFLTAKEHDGIRFRAPEVMNAVIRRLGGSFSKVTIVDAQERLRTESAGGVEDASLFADHLHPNARGYAVIANAFFEAMQASLPALREAFDSAPATAVLDPVEAGYADLQLLMLTSGYPFQKDRSSAEAGSIARARAEAMARSGRYAEALAAQAVMEGEPMANVLHAAVRLALADADTLAALRHYLALLHWQPFNEPLMERAVTLAIENPSYDAETARLARYAATHTRSPFSLNALAALALRGRDLDRAEALLARVENIHPESEEMLYNRARLLVMQGDTAGARTYFDRYRAAR